MSSVSTSSASPKTPPGNQPAPEGAPTHPAMQQAEGVLTKEILVPAVVVVLGAIMTILDATIVNVALPTLGQELHTSISAIQWVPTIYLLAFASVIPLSGWAARTFRDQESVARLLGVLMSIIGVPMLLVPIFGPLIGGSL